MTFDIFFSMLVIAFVMLITPGPNNTLLANSGLRFGLRRSLPHIAGIGIGFPFMVFCISYGLGRVFEQSVFLREGLRILGALVLLWFAWKIATAGVLKPTGSVKKPFTFLQSAAFQWINPKGWVMAIGISSQFVSPAAPLTDALILSITFAIIGFISSISWVIFGQSLRRFLTKNYKILLFNIIMAISLVLSVVLILQSNF